MGKAKNYFKDVQVPADIEFPESSENNIKVHILYPEKNMQEDVAAFESWSLILHEKCKLNIEMTFEIPESYQPHLSMVPEDSSGQHFLRFLFRALKFTNQMEWFSIGNEPCKSCLKRFENWFHNKNTLNNVPNCKAKVSKIRDLNGAKGEHILENIFVYSKKAIKRVEFLTDAQDKILPENLLNQLPNGLFVSSVHKSNQIFPTGFFDLWGVNTENDLCVFELKKEDNLAAGIISELYFYANYANDIFLTHRFNQHSSKYRGYEVLKNAVKKGIKKNPRVFFSTRVSF